LVAELGSAFLSVDLEIHEEPCEENAAYIATWLEVLKKDNRAIFAAAAAATRETYLSVAAIPSRIRHMLDRRDRRAYVAERDQAMILFALMEPEEGDAHDVFVDGMLISSGSKGYIKSRLPRGSLEQMRRFLDGQVGGSQGA
jgi:hypothetical protein